MDAGGLHQQLLRADGLDDLVRPEPASELLDPVHTRVAAVGDDVGRVVLDRELLARFMPAHRDDALRAELFVRQHREQTDSTISDHCDGLAGAGLGGPGAEPAGPEHVGGGEQTGGTPGADTFWLMLGSQASP